MCTPTKLQQHIKDLTNDGELVARFLVDTLNGKHPDAKFHHRVEAAKQLNRYCPTDTEGAAQVPPLPAGEGWGEGSNSTPSPSMGDSTDSPLSPGERVRVRGADNAPSPLMGEGWDGGEKSAPSMSVSYLDILNYDMAHLIREETADGHTIAEFLVNTMTLSDKPYTSKKHRIKPADRMAASREVVNRGFGHFGRKRKLIIDDCNDTNDYDTLHTDLARRLRDYSENGTDAVRFLIEVMSNEDPEQEFTRHHRVSAAQELLRRGWDTNYDSITPRMLQDFWRNQQSPRPPADQQLRETDDSISVGASGKTAQSATSMPPLPEGEGWGEGKIALTRSTSDDEAIPDRYESAEPVKESEDPFNSDTSESLPATQTIDPISPGVRVRANGNTQSSLDKENPTPKDTKTTGSGEHIPIDHHDKIIIQEFQQAMKSGDFQTALRAEMKFAGRMLDRRFQPYIAPAPDSTPQQQHAQPGESGQPDSNHEPPPDAARRGYYDLLKVPLIGSTVNGMTVSAAEPAGTPRKPNIRGP